MTPCPTISFLNTVPTAESFWLSTNIRCGIHTVPKHKAALSNRSQSSLAMRGLTMQSVSEIAQHKQSYRFVKYTFFKLDPDWRRLSDEECSASKNGFLSVMRKNDRLESHSYSLVG